MASYTAASRLITSVEVNRAQDTGYLSGTVHWEQLIFTHTLTDLQRIERRERWVKHVNAGGERAEERAGEDILGTLV